MRHFLMTIISLCLLNVEEYERKRAEILKEL